MKISSFTHTETLNIYMIYTQVVLKEFTNVPTDRKKKIDNDGK